VTEGVFVSYRRDDAPGHAGRLYDRLAGRFGADRVFMDVDSIDPGEDFVNVIESTLASASVVVVVIGPTWVTARDEQGVVRLTKPDDFVHLEVSRALQLQKLVIPVLVDDATVPDAEELPEDLRPLARRNAFEISDGRFHSDADRLADAIAESMAGPKVEPPPGGPAAPAPPGSGGLGGFIRRVGWPIVVAAVLAVLMVVGAVVWVLSSGDDDAATTTTGVETTSGAGPAATTTPPTGGTGAPAVVPASVVGELPTTGQPVEVLVAGGTLWGSVDGGIERFAPPGPDAQPTGTVDLGGPGFGNDLIVWDGVLYVTRFDAQSLQALDIVTGALRGAPIGLPGKPLTGVVSGDTLWLAVHGSSSGAPGSVVAVRDGAVVDEIPLDQLPYQIEAVADRLWVTFFHAGTLGLIDPTSRQVTQFPVGADPVDVRLIGGQLWVTVSGEDKVVLVDPASGAVAETIEVGDRPWKVVEGFGAVWVSNHGDGQAVLPDEIAVGTDDLFVGNFGSRSISVIDPGSAS
jgi:YVTN family beta-propeller protein